MKKRFIGKFITTCAGLVVMGMLLGNGFINVRVYADTNPPEEYDIDLDTISIEGNDNCEGEKGDFDIKIDENLDGTMEHEFHDVIETQSQGDAPASDVPPEKMKAPESSKVYIECNPSEGYQVEKVDVTDAELGNSVNVSKDDTNRYSFMMPGFNIYVSVIFKQKQDPIPTPTPTPTLTPISETIETEVLQESSMLSRLSKGVAFPYEVSLCDAMGAWDTLGMEVHEVDEKTKANQQFLVQTLVGPNAQIFVTRNVNIRRELSLLENGSLQTLTWNNLPKNQPGAISAVVYNQIDGAYVIHGILDTNGTSTFTGFKLRPASTITICK